MKQSSVTSRRDQRDQETIQLANELLSKKANMTRIVNMTEDVHFFVFSVHM